MTDWTAEANRLMEMAQRLPYDDLRWRAISGGAQNADDDYDRADAAWDRCFVSSAYCLADDFGITL